jgi:hypothetical protein
MASQPVGGDCNLQQLLSSPSEPASNQFTSDVRLYAAFLLQQLQLEVDLFVGVRR